MPDPKTVKVKHPDVSGAFMIVNEEDASSYEPFEDGETTPVLRTDGPTLEEFVLAGYSPRLYPPQGCVAKDFDSETFERLAAAWDKRQEDRAKERAERELAEAAKDAADALSNPPDLLDAAKADLPHEVPMTDPSRVEPFEAPATVSTDVPVDLSTTNAAPVDAPVPTTTAPESPKKGKRARA